MCGVDLYKYLHKGPDRAMVAAARFDEFGYDEVSEFENLRSFGAVEGCWRTFNFALQDRSPPVIRLAVHLEDAQPCLYEEGDEAAAVDRGPPVTTLTAWFDFLTERHLQRRYDDDNVEDDDDPFALTYVTFATKYRFDKASNAWRRRL